MKLISQYAGQAIMQEMNIHKETGLTREEIEIHTGISGNTVRPRILELIEEGKIIESTQYRLTKSGRKARVLFIANQIV
jgi:response regulator of citrate/malate metabolism